MKQGTHSKRRGSTESSAMGSTQDTATPTSPERTPKTDSESSQLPVPRHYLFFVALGSLSWAGGFVVAIFVLITLPAETSKLWPYNSTLWLGILKFVIGLIQISSPMVGLWSDGFKNDYGRRRPFIVFGTVGFTAGCGLLLLGSFLNSAIIYTLALVVTFLGLSTVQTVHSALFGDVVSVEETGLATGINTAMGHLGSCCGFLLMSLVQPPLLYNNLIFMGVLAIAATIVCFTVHEQNSNELTNLPAAASWSGMVKTFTNLLQSVEHRSFLYLTLAKTFFFYSTSISSYLFFFLRDEIHTDFNQSQGVAAMLGGTTELTAIAVALLVGIYSHKIPVSRRTLLLISTIAMAVCLLGLVISKLIFNVAGLLAVKLYLIFLGMCLGATIGSYGAVEFALALDLIPDKDMCATLLGMWAISRFLGESIGGAINGVALESFRLPITTGDDVVRYGLDGYLLTVVLSIIGLVTCGVLLSRIPNTRQSLSVGRCTSGDSLSRSLSSHSYQAV